MLGSNSADTAGNRIKARTKESSSPGTASGAPRRRRPTILTDRPTSPRWCRGPTTTSARPSRRALPQTRSLPTVRLSTCTASPTSRRRCGNRRERGPARRRHPLCLRHAGRRPWRRANTGGPGGLADGAKLLGQLRQDGRSERIGTANLAAPRRRQGSNLRLPARWFRGCRARSPESAVGRDRESHGVGKRDDSAVARQ